MILLWQADPIGYNALLYMLHDFIYVAFGDNRIPSLLNCSTSFNFMAVTAMTYVLILISALPLRLLPYSYAARPPW